VNRQWRGGKGDWGLGIGVNEGSGIHATYTTIDGLTRICQDEQTKAIHEDVFRCGLERELGYVPHRWNPIPEGKAVG